MSITLGKRSFEAASKYMLRGFTVSYNSLSMSGTLRNMGLVNCADWCLQKSETYRSGAMKIFHHLESRGIKFKLAPIPVSRQDWRAPLHIFEEVYRQEQELSDLISVVYESAIADKDYIMQQFAMDFFDDHLKSESKALNLLNRLRKMQSSDLGVFEFDAELRSIL
ncbi:MAG: hypothetical protein J6T91_04355 [Alphaproteobacteria bacterium]|nr:hypothetical protein [Alphaproteobacteria bacterium]